MQTKAETTCVRYNILLKCEINDLLRLLFHHGKPPPRSLLDETDAPALQHATLRYREIRSAQPWTVPLNLLRDASTEQL